MASDMLIICPNENCGFHNDTLEAWSAEHSTFFEVYVCVACGHAFKDDEAIYVRRDGKIEVEFNCHNVGGTIGWKHLTEKQLYQMALGDRVMFEGIGYMFTITQCVYNSPHPKGMVELELLFNPPPKPKFLITLDRKK
jgi:hypothetical protein